MPRLSDEVTRLVNRTARELCVARMHLSCFASVPGGPIRLQLLGTSFAHLSSPGRGDASLVHSSPFAPPPHRGLPSASSVARRREAKSATATIRTLPVLPLWLCLSPRPPPSVDVDQARELKASKIASWNVDAPFLCVRSS